MVLSDWEIARIAWRLLLKGADSFAEDWFDEDGAFSPDDENAVYETMKRVVEYLLDHTEKLFDGEISAFVVTGYE